MRFEERDEGDYRIYAGAREISRTGYIAAVVVQRVRGSPEAPHEACRYEDLADGQVWPNAEQALAFAIDKGCAAARALERRLAVAEDARVRAAPAAPVASPKTAQAHLLKVLNDWPPRAGAGSGDRLSGALTAESG